MNADCHWSILSGDCRRALMALDAESVQTVVTSPPFFGLRDYDHSDQIGLEETPKQYVTEMVHVFREVMRVLRRDGVVWLNLGDSYNDAKATRHPSATEGYGKHNYVDDGDGVSVRANAPGLKPKDLIGIPWRVAFALQEDGWYLRSEVIWAKPNPMPESVRDRPTKAHEQIFLLAKHPRYFYDADAIREPHSAESIKRVEERPWHNPGHKWEDGPGRHDLANSAEKALHPAGRNKRSVWEIATVPYKDAHFATFPPKLVEPCVKAGTPEAGVCGECSTPWVRITTRTRTKDGEEEIDGGWEQDDAGRIGAQGVGHWRFSTNVDTLGWRPNCTCGAPRMDDYSLQPDDLDLIESPTGEGGDDDPSLEVGRAGFSRPRGVGGGKAVITRYQQRRYAVQLKRLPVDEQAALRERFELTKDAWAHYVRTDAVGGRPLPPAILSVLIEELVLEPVDPPAWEPPATRPAVVLDPFSGAGTTGVVSLRLGRSYIGIELNPDYAEQSRERIREDGPMWNVPAEVVGAA